MSVTFEQLLQINKNNIQFVQAPIQLKLKEADFNRQKKFDNDLMAVLHDYVTNILIDKPDNVPDFTINYFQNLKFKK